MWVNLLRTVAGVHYANPQKVISQAEKVTKDGRLVIVLVTSLTSKIDYQTPSWTCRKSQKDDL